MSAAVNNEDSIDDLANDFQNIEAVIQEVGGIEPDSPTPTLKDILAHRPSIPNISKP